MAKAVSAQSDTALTYIPPQKQSGRKSLTRSPILGGKTGIRTLGTRKGTTVFETVPIDRSGIFPLVDAARWSGAAICGGQPSWRWQKAPRGAVLLCHRRLCSACGLLFSQIKSVSIESPHDSG